MAEWFYEFHKKLLEFTPALWIALAVLAIGGVAMWLALKKDGKKASKALVLGIAAIMVIALVVVAAFFIPAMELEEGTNMNVLYQGWFWTLVIVIILVVVLALMIRRQVWTAKMLAMGAVCIAMSVLLAAIRLYRLPNGGSITPASMLPIFVFAWIYGVPAGLSVGLVHGILQLTLGAYVLHPVQFLLDYILPFTMLGFAGLFHKMDIKGLWIGIWVGGALRFIMHLLSGVIFFASYAPEGQSPFVYSFLYNGSYMLPDLILATVIAMIPPVSKLFMRLKKNALTEG